jgi:RimJ/RimL family protein N-acetyltransferase
VRWTEDPDFLRNGDTAAAVPRSLATVAKDLQEPPGHDTFYFHFRAIEDDRLLGFAVLHSVEWNNRAGVLAIGIWDPRNRGRGYGADALRTLLRYAFNELNLQRVGLDVIANNAAAIRAYERVGFRREGAMREAVLRAMVGKGSTVLRTQRSNTLRTRQTIGRT